MAKSSKSSKKSSKKASKGSKAGKAVRAAVKSSRGSRTEGLWSWRNGAPAWAPVEKAKYLLPEGKYAIEMLSLEGDGDQCIKSCSFGWVLPCFSVARSCSLASDKESCSWATCWIGTALCVTSPCGIWLCAACVNRCGVEARYAIDGSCCANFWKTCLCHPCALAQVERELHTRSEYKDFGVLAASGSASAAGSDDSNSGSARWTVESS
eukprot:c52471_g1_i1.p1 GENE.c52471_g1_i1~~c52471_g1_i1.p1  ORF type:complete len:220 (+),score=30.59 c52471_g1_i1:34-660(+)